MLEPHAGFLDYRVFICIRSGPSPDLSSASTHFCPAFSFTKAQASCNYPDRRLAVLHDGLAPMLNASHDCLRLEASPLPCSLRGIAFDPPTPSVRIISPCFPRPRFKFGLSSLVPEIFTKRTRLAWSIGSLMRHDVRNVKPCGRSPLGNVLDVRASTLHPSCVPGDAMSATRSISLLLPGSPRPFRIRPVVHCFLHRPSSTALGTQVAHIFPSVAAKSFEVAECGQHIHLNLAVVAIQHSSSFIRCIEFRLPCASANCL